MNGGLPKFWGKKGTYGQFQLGKRGTKAKCLREQGEKKRFREHGNKELLCYREDEKKGEKRRNRHLSCDIFFSFFQSVFMEPRQRLNWVMSICYEATLGNWMLSKINNKIGEKQEHRGITVTTYYPGGKSRGGSARPLHHR